MTEPDALRLGLVGHPVAHSVSPDMHRAALAAAGLTGDYELLDVPPEQLEGCVAGLRAGLRSGLNVTVPHKGAAARFCDRLAPEAALAGAANTLVRSPDGRIEGHNTDIAGLVAALQQAFSAAPWRGRAAVVLGAGGAGRASVLAAFQAGASEVRVWNRTPERAQALVGELAPKVAGALVAFADPVEAARGAALVLQATTRGMATTVGDPAWSAARDEAARVIAATAPDAAVLDLVYRPRETPWVAAARASGRRADDGLEMLVQQAAWAFRLWTGRTADPAVMRAAAEAALAPEKGGP
ncbi:MAG: shikimate dehydrogenase [Deltaproteobacteria bacterium]|nr:shikimate dehydrogenase [Deltaproteobacteria bacterium]